MKLKNKRGPIAVVLGTRPEIIKLSSLLRLFKRQNRPEDLLLIHTGQHYSYNMDAQFFKDLELPEPHYKFTRSSHIGSNMHEELVKSIQSDVQKVLEKEEPASVLVQGDTDTVLAGARAAVQTGGITIGHVEAGLRSYDNEMPEERNRIATDQLSHILFAPTEAAKKNLIKEKLDAKRIEVTGNTIVDALFENLTIAQKSAGKDFQKGYALVTLHRPETVDNPKRLLDVFRALEALLEKTRLKKIIFPMHPRTRQRCKEFGVALDELARRAILTPEPMGFLDFIWHEKNADIILTDSGGVQEEACILKVPCVTVRTTTERPETVEAGGNTVAGYDPDQIVSSALRMMEKKRNWPNPFGDGKASERILKTVDGLS